jgi:hypothetical protein
VHANKVAKQLLTMLKMVRLLVSEALPDIGGFERVGGPESKRIYRRVPFELAASAGKGLHYYTGMHSC